MSSSVRPYDVGRYGGEEFLIVAASADGAGALAFTERMRAAVESQPYATDTGDLHIAALFGDESSSGARTIKSNALLQIADEAHHRAGLQGRNRPGRTALPEHLEPTRIVSTDRVFTALVLGIQI